MARLLCCDSRIGQLRREASHHRVVIDVHRAWTGQNCHLFEETSLEYEDLKALFGKRGFRRINLALNVGDVHYYEWRSYRSGLLKKALASSHDLEHFYFHTNTVHDGGIPESQFVPLLDVFPITQWPRLTHFGLSCFLVEMDDLVSFLAQLPPSIQKNELSALELLQGNWEQLLTHTRDELPWQSRTSPPKITISILGMLGISGLATWVSGEVDSFFYSGGPNPFQHNFPNDIALGTGIVSRISMKVMTGRMLTL
jgi:hypothetical protein